LALPLDVVASGIEKTPKREPLTLEEFIAATDGFLPDEFRAMWLAYKATERHET
jgi:hypothetical protein